MSKANMRIGIDGFNLAMPYGTGVATYARTLAAAVRELGYKLDLVYDVPVALDAPEEIRETLFYGRLSEDRAPSERASLTLFEKLKRALITPEKRKLLPIPRGGRVVTTGLEGRVPAHDRLFTRGNIFNVSARYFRRFGRFMPIVMPDPPSIMHWTYPLPLRLEGAKNIYTFHDIVPLKLPHTSLEDKRYYHKLLKQCVQTADHIVTVSEASRSDIVEFFPDANNKMTNTYQTVEAFEDVCPEDVAGRLDRLFDLQPEQYLLFFGAIEPKKNLGRIIEAYLEADLTTPLVIVGSTGWRSEQELRLLEGGMGKLLRGASGIRRIGYLPRRFLNDLIRGARIVLFPSLYEGFGLPALEALSAGRPVIASNSSSLPEILGDAAVLVDPYDVKALASAMKRLDGDEQLRKTLAAAGVRRAVLFEAPRYADRVEQMYQTVANHRNVERSES